MNRVILHSVKPPLCVFSTHLDGTEQRLAAKALFPGGDY